MSFNRRELLKYLAMTSSASLIATSGIENLARALMPSNGPQNLYNSIDTFKILQHMPWIKKSGVLVPESTAMAQENDDSVIITVKVLNHIHSPLCFKFDYTGSSDAAMPWAAKIPTGAIRTQMLSAGLDEMTDIPRWEKLKLNKWFAKILNSGMPEDEKRSAVLNETEIGEFPSEEDVAFQAFLSVNQTSPSLNHSFQNTTLRNSAKVGHGGDINYHLAMNNIIKSPLGVTALTMSTVETTDSIGRVANRVVSNNLVDVAAEGRPVEKYVSLLAQSIGTGFINEELLDKFDAFAGVESELRQQMAASRPEIKRKISDLRATAEAEKQEHTIDVANISNTQSFTGSIMETAHQQFIAQCLFAKRVLEIPGKPLRNFSLLLNLKDIDGAGLEVTAVERDSQPFSYIEGMRQLGIGLNILAHAIKKHKNVYVVVISEGGRASTRGDNKVSHSFIMGPGGSGGLKDHLYANTTALNNPSDAFNADPNRGSANSTGVGLKYYENGELISEAGNVVKDEYADVAGVLNGLVKHIEEKTKVGNSTTGGLGNYVKLVKK